MQKLADQMKAKEKVVWEKAYNDQNKYFTWPDEIEKKYEFQKGLFFSEVKVDKSAAPPAGQPADRQTEDTSVVKTASGTLKDGNEIYLLVSDGKENRKFRPTRNYKAINGDGKPVNTFVDLLDPSSPPRVSLSYTVGKYFNDPLTRDEQTDYGKHYKDQIHPLLRQVQPMNAKGEGVVQLRGWSYDEASFPPENAPFLRDVAKEWDTVGNISEEAWIAQEDLWIQHELYHLVRQTNDMVSVFEGKGGKDPHKWYTFTNPYWKLDLKLAGPKKLAAKITNLLPRRQKLDPQFLISVREEANVEPEVLMFRTEPLDPGKEQLKEYDIQGAVPRHIPRRAAHYLGDGSSQAD